MNPLSLLITEILYRPIFNLLIVFLAIFGGNLGISIVLLTVVIRLLLVKQTSLGNDMQKGMGDLQPKLNEIQEKYKDDPKKLSAETMKVFKTHGKAPLKGCLMLLVQIPVFIGLYTIIRKISNNQIDPSYIYSFFYGFGQQFLNPENINHNFLGMNLLQNHNVILTILGAIFTFLQMKLTTLIKPAAAPAGGANMPDMSKMMGMMNYFMVIMMGTFVRSTQSGVGLYIVTTTLFSVVQYSIQYRAVLKVKWIELTQKGKGIVINNK